MLCTLSMAMAHPQCAHTPPYPHCNYSYPRQHAFSVRVVERDPFHGRPLISAAHGDSSFQYNFNGPWFRPPPGRKARDGLIVRVQENWRSPGATHPEWTDTGALTVIEADLDAGTAGHIDETRVFWPGTNAPEKMNHTCEHPHPLCSWGAIDPRIQYRPKTGEYFLTWDNCSFECAFRSSMLSISEDPFDKQSWTLVGPVIPHMQTAGVALLFRDDGVDGTAEQQHLAFVTAYDCFTISLAESRDGRAWAVTDADWMQGRPGCWDACGAIAGPQPERLSSGDYLFVYNIDTEAAGKGNDTAPLGRCTVGWAVLSSSDPRKVVARSSTAIITPELPWETTGCAAGKPGTCQTPRVIFATGLRPLGGDAFLIIYGGGDTDTAAIKIQVDIKQPK